MLGNGHHCLGLVSDFMRVAQQLDETNDVMQLGNSTHYFNNQ